MSRPSCAEVRAALSAYQAYRLAPDDEVALREHLASCAACREQDAKERALSELLAARLPRPSAPDALKLRLAALVESAVPTVETAASTTAAPVRRLRLSRAVALFAPVVLAAAALLIVLRPDGTAQNDLVRELVNDHLRVLYAERPIEIESGGIHQVKPWFAGRLDFAPRVTVEDDPQFPLVGGAVAYVVDRKAATFVFKCRLHTVSLRR
jgi:anti-sigma factor RsiW